MKKQIEKWKQKSMLGKISDLLFLALIVAMIIPQSRKAIMAGVNNVKAKIIPPSVKEEPIATLGEADYSWQLVDIEGNNHSLAEFKGKVIFINFWATWCGPCVGEMPEIQKFYDKFKNNNNVVFILASQDDLQTMKNFMQKKDYNFPVYTVASQTPENLASRSIPTSFLINKNGEIVMRTVGVANWGGKKMENLVKDLLK